MPKNVAEFVSQANAEGVPDFALHYSRFLSEADSWAIDQIVKSAILAEREECAKICEFQAANSISALDCGSRGAGRIRARSNAPQSSNQPPQ